MQKINKFSGMGRLMFTASVVTLSQIPIGGFMVVAAAAQEQVRSHITGRVIDKATGVGLTGARVRIEGETGSIYTKDGGFFDMPVKGPGDYKLLVEFLGYPESQADVVVDSGGRTQIEIALGSGDAMDEITVTARILQMNKGLSRERASDSLVSIMSSDVAGQFPDRNIAEMLQRVSGVTLRSQTGEGSFAVLRGILPQLSTATVNGHTIQSVQSEGRETRLGYFGSATVERVEVEKVFTPDMAGDFIGGNINVVTKSALDVAGPYFGGSIEGGKSSLAEGAYFEIEGTVANTFLDDRLGILVSLNYADRPQQTEGVVSGLVSNGRPDPSQIDLLPLFAADPNPNIIDLPAASTSFRMPLDLSLAQNELTAERISGAVDIDFRPDDKQRYRLLGSFTRLKETRLLQNAILANGLFVGPSGFGAATVPLLEVFRGPEETPVFHAATPIIFGQNQPRKVFNGNISLITEQEIGGFEMEASISYGRGKIDSTNFQFGAGFILDASAAGPFQFGYDFSDTDFPGFIIPDVALSAIADPASYNQIFELKRRSQNGIEEEITGRIDFERPLALKGPTKANIKFGFLASSKNKRTDVDTVQYVTAINASSGTPALVPPSVPLGLFTASMQGNSNLNSSLAGGRYSFGPFINLAAAEDWVLANFADGIKTDQSVFESALRDFTADEDVYAGYGRVDIETESGVLVIAGARVEKYTTKMGSFAGIFGAPSVFVTSENSKTLFLPSLVIKAEPRDNLVVRAGLTRTYARPTFEQTAPRAQFNPLNGSVSGVGNPDLKPIMSTNFDFSVDYYTRPLGVIRAGIYHKRLTDLVINVQQELGIDEQFRGVAPPTGTAWTVSTLDNAAGSYISGIELGFQRMFSDLPAPFNGFGVSANYLYTKSEADLLDVNGAFVRSTSLELASEHSGNISLLYDLNSIKARLAYRYQGEALFRLGPEAVFDRYVDDRSQLDFSIQYAATENVAVFFEAFNLTDKAFRVYQGTQNVQKQTEVQGRQFGAGLRFRF